MSRHVIVIGAGVVGLCSAYYLMQRGCEVTVIESNGEERDGCSFGNAGMIVPSHFVPLAAPGAVAQGLRWMRDPASPFYIKPRLSAGLVDWGIKFWSAANAARVNRAAPVLRNLNMASLACYEALAADDDAFGLAKTGTLMLCRTHEALEEEARTARLAQELGLTARVLNAADTQALEPEMRMDVVGSVLFPDDAHVIPERVVDFLQRDLQQRGATFCWNTQVTGFTVEAGWIRGVQCNDGIITGDEVVLAAGSWSAALARKLDLDIPLQPGKGYSLTLARPRALPRCSAILTEARVAVSSMDTALRFGGTMELAGFDPAVNPIRVRSIVEAIARYYPDFQASDFDGVPAWRGFRPCSPDGLPYLGRPRRVANLIVATGHAMMGVSLAPITGKLVSQIVAGEPTSLDIALLSPDRYH